MTHVAVTVTLVLLARAVGVIVTACEDRQAVAVGWALVVGLWAD